MDWKPIAGLIAIIVIILLIRNAFLGSVIPHEKTFTFMGYSGTGHYVSTDFEPKQGSGSSFLNTEGSTLSMGASTSGQGTAPPDSVYADFILSIGTLKDFCVSNGVDVSKSDCGASSSLTLCSGNSCIPIQSQGWCGFEPCSATKFNCYSFEWQIVNGIKYLIIMQGSNSNTINADNLDPNNLQLKGAVNTRFYNWASCSSSLTVSNLEVVTCKTSADTDCNGAVSNQELLDYIDLWVANSATNEQLLSAIDAWSTST